MDVEFNNVETTNKKLQNKTDNNSKRILHEKLVNFNVKNLSQATEIKQKFSRKIGFIGDGNTQVIVKFKTYLKISKEKYLIIEESLKHLAKVLEIEKRMVKVSFPKEIEKPNLSIIIFSENDMQDVLDVRNELSDFIKGRLIVELDYFKVLIFFNTKNNIHKVAIQKKYKVYLENLSEIKEIRVVGDNEMSKKAIAEIVTILSNSQYIYKKIDYNGKSIAPFFKNNKEMMNKMNSDYQDSRLTIDLRNKFILIFGKEHQVTLMMQEVEKLIKLERLKGECQICCGNTNNPYKMLLCNDNCQPFCRICIEELILQVANSPQNLPMKCPTCQNFISLKDFRILIKHQDQKKLLKYCFNQYVSRNPNLYKFCPKPGCEGLIKLLPNLPTNARLNCDMCNFNFCRKCDNAYHEGVTCQEGEMGRDAKRCPSCQAPIHKTDGCNHMTCNICRNHFCWTCLAFYPTAPEVYSHLNKVHGSYV
jgi:hypothetical protein